ncbi:Tubby-related protein 3 [Fragariocoptes setiger]|uniref:Tubby-related protein 3 n=1 Tax=Fragariocoptes setiger TaxID=1670756 RepID=A0ABQ7S6W7_9ACAR|nr:Tubby-related protein 3 [Fragariocoptes setiger]
MVSIETQIQAIENERHSAAVDFALGRKTILRPIVLPKAAPVKPEVVATDTSDTQIPRTQSQSQALPTTSSNDAKEDQRNDDDSLSQGGSSSASSSFSSPGQSLTTSLHPANNELGAKTSSVTNLLACCELDSPYDPSNDINPLTSVMTDEEMCEFACCPVPTSCTYQCLIVRDKSGIDRSFYPTYYLHLQSIVPTVETDRHDHQYSHMAPSVDFPSTSTNQLIHRQSHDSFDNIDSESEVSPLRSTQIDTGPMTTDMMARRPTTTSSAADELIAQQLTQEPKQQQQKARIEQVFVLAGRRRKKTKTTDLGKNRRHKVASISYETNVLGFKGPRKMTILIPDARLYSKTMKSHDNNLPVDIDFEEILKTGQVVDFPLIQLKNKTPSWNLESQSYVLNFHGRVTQASVKNFQLIRCYPEQDEPSTNANGPTANGRPPPTGTQMDKQNIGTNNDNYWRGFDMTPKRDRDFFDTTNDSASAPIVMQFGRISEREFTCDVSHPLSLLQAFSIALNTKKYIMPFELFIMSESGKPIYSYSRRDDVITLMPVCQALLSFAKKSQRDTLKSITISSQVRINFFIRTPLIIIVVDKLNTFLDPLSLITQMEAQIVSVLTSETLKTVFQRHPTFDLRKLLQGSEKLLDSTAHLMLEFQQDQQFPWLQAYMSSGAKLKVLVPVVMMPPNYRDQYTNMLTSQSPSMLFSILFRVSHTDDPNESNTAIDTNEDTKVNSMRFELITVCNYHSNAHKLSVADMQTLLALLYGSRSQLVVVESLWMPVCLPRFNESAFLHAHISLLVDQTHCLVVMTVDRDEFQKCQTFKTTCEERLAKMAPKFRDNYRLSPLLPAVTSSDYLALRQVQFVWYQTQRRVLVWQQSPHWSMSQLICYVAHRMSASHLKTMWLKCRGDKTILGWHVSTFQLYAQFDATITPSQALEAVQVLMAWIKKEEDCFTFKEYNNFEVQNQRIVDGCCPSVVQGPTRQVTNVAPAVPLAAPVIAVAPPPVVHTIHPAPPAEVKSYSIETGHQIAHDTTHFSPVFQSTHHAPVVHTAPVIAQVPVAAPVYARPLPPAPMIAARHPPTLPAY